MIGLKSYTEAKLLWATRLADALVPILLAIIMQLVYEPEYAFYEEGRFLVAMIAATLLTANIFHNLELYTMPALANLQRQLSRVFVGWTAVMALLLLAAFAAKVSSNFSRVWTILWFVSALGGFAVIRIIVHEIIRRWTESGRLVREVAVYGAGAQGRRMIEFLQRPGSGFRVVGVFDDREHAAAQLGDSLGAPYRGNLEALLEFARRQPLDQIVLALPWSGERRIAQIMTRLSPLPIDVRLAPDLVGFSLAHCRYGEVAGLPVLNVFDKPLSEEKLVLKRAEDIVIALGLLILFSPLMLAIAILIKIGSPGPVFFRQTRFGFNNQAISVWKFRTMYAEECRDVIESQTLRDDPRVTPIGRWLRRTSMDELPQLFNVLQGSMSVVGPRPHAEGTRAGNVLFEEAVSEYAARHRVKPGLTGWAQVNGWRGETDTLEKIQQRVDHDLYYIENWSLMFDIKIVLMTIFTIMRGRNAW
jgi:Undecaprenyl-phosphate glucose phosphotransferase